MKVPHSELLAALSLIEHAPSRSGITTSEMVRMRVADGVLRLDLSSETFAAARVKVQHEDAWEAYLDRSVFRAFLLADATQKPFVFKRGPQSLLVTHGKRVAKFAANTEVSGYITLRKDDPETMKVTNELVAHLLLAANFASPDPTVPKFNCVWLERGEGMLATNDACAIIVPHTSVKVTTPFPLQLLKAISTARPEQLEITPRHVRFRASNGHVGQLLNKKSSAEFPARQIRKAIGDMRQAPRVFKVASHLFGDALKRLDACVSTVARKEATVTLATEKGSNMLLLKAKIAYGSFEEPVKLLAPADRTMSRQLLLPFALAFAQNTDGDLTLRYHVAEKASVGRFYLKCGAELLTSEVVNA